MRISHEERVSSDTNSVRPFPDFRVLSPTDHGPDTSADASGEAGTTPMNDEPPETLWMDNSHRKVGGSNGRQFARCPIDAQQMPAILNVKRRRFDCRIVEMSIGGFGVILQRDLTLPSGTIGSLQAPGLNYIVNVTHQESRPEGTYIGLKQIEEVLDDQHFPGQPSPMVGYVVSSIAIGAIVAFSYLLMYVH